MDLLKRCVTNTFRLDCIGGIRYAIYHELGSPQNLETYSVLGALRENDILCCKAEEIIYIFIQDGIKEEGTEENDNEATVPGNLSNCKIFLTVYLRKLICIN